MFSIIFLRTFLLSSISMNHFLTIFPFLILIYFLDFFHPFLVHSLSCFPHLPFFFFIILPSRYLSSHCLLHFLIFNNSTSSSFSLLFSYFIHFFPFFCPTLSPIFSYFSLLHPLFSYFFPHLALFFFINFPSRYLSSYFLLCFPIFSPTSFHLLFSLLFLILHS